LKKIKLLPLWKNLFKNKENKMNTEKLISLKENFTGQKFQWIKTNRPELLGKVVKCRDVDFGPNDKFIVKFDDGSSIDSTRLNNDLLMILGDMKPLSKDEVDAIYNSVKVKASAPAVNQSPQPAQVKVVPPAAQVQPQPIQPAPQAQPISSEEAPKSNMFAMFNSEESQLAINLTVRIPDKKLLKMMYGSAENKEKFLSELAEYLHGMINKKVVQDAIKTVLAPAPTKKEPKPIINLTEVNDSR